MTQHTTLTLDRWKSFTLDQQILMIGTEMNRAGKFRNPEDRERRINSYERVLRLADLTIQAHSRPGLLRELKLWRDLAAQLYLQPDPQTSAHAEAFRALLLFTPEASRQIPHVLSPRREAER